ncbi:hypothetical protein BDW59DRAFT_48387 [Aspergillus cavernicola]|uniref:Uncharacterized protein n=1 Tax=Aspergillus cavernicola TaxID=176166 RepID=A0ABR4J386_9EURO
MADGMLLVMDPLPSPIIDNRGGYAALMPFLDSPPSLLLLFNATFISGFDHWSVSWYKQRRLRRSISNSSRTG